MSKTSRIAALESRMTAMERQLRHVQPAPDVQPAAYSPDILAERLRRHCHDNYNGGHHEAETNAAFHHGIDTACNVLAAQPTAPAADVPHECLVVPCPECGFNGGIGVKGRSTGVIANITLTRQPAAQQPESQQPAEPSIGEQIENMGQDELSLLAQTVLAELRKRRLAQEAPHDPR